MLLDFHADVPTSVDNLNKQVQVILGLVDEVKFYVINPNDTKGNNVKGSQNKIAGQGNTVAGSENLVAGTNNTVVGEAAKVGGCQNVAVCKNSTVVGQDSFVVGSNLSVKGDKNVVFSKNQTVSTSNRLIVDDYSLNIDDDPTTSLDVTRLN